MVHLPAPTESRGSDAHFLSLWALHALEAQIYMQAKYPYNTQSWKIKKIQ